MMVSISSKFHFKVLYADFKSILKRIDENHREKMNQMKPEHNSEIPYTAEINTQSPSGWCVHSILAYGYTFDPLKMYRGKD